MAELTAVLVITGILAGAMVPVVMRLDSARAGEAIALIESDVGFARQWAIATGTRTWIDFDLDAQTWRVLVEDPDAPGRANAGAMADPAGAGIGGAEGRGLGGRLGADSFVGVTMDGAAFDDAPTVGFDWLGRPLNEDEGPLEAPGGVVLSSGDELRVEVSTGRVWRSKD